VRPRSLRGHVVALEKKILYIIIIGGILVLFTHITRLASNEIF